MSEGLGWPELAAALAEMSRDLYSQDSWGETLDRIVLHAVALVDGCDAAGIMAVRDGHVLTLAASDDMVRASDRIQGELGEGPCFDATRNQHEAYRIADMTTYEPRWPRYAPKAAELGVGSAMGFLLHASGQDNLGALDLYSSRPNTFAEHHERVGWLLASHAAVAMAGIEHESHLHRALESRRMIGIAIGIVMERCGLDEADAFARMCKISQNTNVKVCDLARSIVATRVIPGEHRAR